MRRMASCFFLLSILMTGLTIPWTSHQQSISLDGIDHLWEQYKLLYRKDYAGLEDEIRMSAFLQNVQFIANHNLEADLGLHSFWLSVNQFADYTNEEFKSYTGSLAADSNFKANNTYTGFTWEIPDHLDWRSKKIVSPVRDQGSCSASYAFAAIASLEGQHALYTGSLQELSAQQVIDCSSDFGNDGCCRGSVYNAFKYIESAGGIDAYDEYPYQSSYSMCRFNRQHVAAKVTGFVSLLEDEAILKDAVANVGPIAVSIDACPSYFQFYSSGVLSNITCSSRHSHALVVVGYGSDEGEDFWLLKNSWGGTWGEEGFLRLARNRDNFCGIASNAGYPLLQTF